MRLRLCLPWFLASVGCGDDTAEDCSNAVDDDGDGYEDCADQDCFDDAACVETICDDAMDDDGDGRVDCDDPDCASACAPVDCTDGCAEDCSNGVDDDRDFLVDCADDDCDAVCDVDGDGLAGLGGPDCDDTRADVHPEMEEVPYDGADNDCDALTPDDDLDGDGFALAADCDDAVAATFPGAPETCGNGQLDDCDNPNPPATSVCWGPRSFLTADARFVSPTADGWLGVAVAPLDDVDGDDVPEFLMGMYGDNNASGAVIVASAPAGGVFDIVNARTKITGESEEDWAGYSVARIGGTVGGGPDVDFAVGAPYDDTSASTSGCVYVVDAGRAGTGEFKDVHAQIQGERAGDQLGAAVAPAGDVNGDGVFDLLAGAPLLGGDDVGAAYVFFGPIRPGDMLADEAQTKFQGTEFQAQFGGAVAGGKDLDGDDRVDVVVGARFSDATGISSGAVYVFRDVSPGIVLQDQAVARFVGSGENARAGSALALGDLDGDGLADIVIGSPGHADDAGIVDVVRGDASGELVSFASFEGALGDLVGTAVDVADIDGDGALDLLVGAPGADQGGQDAGVAYVFFGPLAGDLTPDVVIYGEVPFGFVGQSVAGAPDWTGDGRDELIIGAPFVDGAASSSGEVGVFWWGW